MLDILFSIVSYGSIAIVVIILLVLLRLAFQISAVVNEEHDKTGESKKELLSELGKGIK